MGSQRVASRALPSPLRRADAGREAARRLRAADENQNKLARQYNQNAVLSDAHGHDGTEARGHLGRG